TSPVFHPDGNQLYFAGIEGLQSFIFSLDLRSGRIRKLTNGRLYVKAVDISADGEKVVYSASDGEFEKLYLAAAANPDLAMRLTDGAYNDVAPAFALDGKTVYYSSDERGAFNICSLDLENKIFYRYTDVRSGNFFPVEIPHEKGQLVISSYHKGSFLLFKKDAGTFLEKRPAQFSAISAAPVVAAAEPPLTFTLAPKKYKPFEKLIITSLPPILVAVDTSGGFFGASYLGVTDLLGDQNFVFYLSSFYGYRSYHFTYLNQQRRLQYYAHLFSEGEGYYLSYNYTNYFSLRSRIGGQLGFIYPFSRSTRAELYLSVFHQTEDSDLFYYGYKLPYGQFFNGMAMPLEVALVSETTRFANYGPNMGHTFKFSVSKYISLFSDSLDAFILEGDFRKYLRIDNQSLLAFRLSGFYSGGTNPLLFWSGGNNTLRAADFRSLIGNKGFFFNAEFRFPLVMAALTPIGIIGPVRGVFFFDLGGVWFNDQPFVFSKDGKLQDSLASLGYGIEFFLFGYPLHVEWVYKTDFQNTTYNGINFWIGFDF
ncbi:MAG: BamA/TamA family outer membrane protein, partial [Candidatus Aminicenantes bacterium]|nr:BamA/TamA family outer membrane protein [Candidatus Aminicenantes bacterium]